MSDPILQLVERLPRAEPDGAHTSRVRARCRAALESRKRDETTSTTSARTGAFALSAICLAYLTVIIRELLRLSRPL